MRHSLVPIYARDVGVYLGCVQPATRKHICPFRHLLFGAMWDPRRLHESHGGHRTRSCMRQLAKLWRRLRTFLARAGGKLAMGNYDHEITRLQTRGNVKLAGSLRVQTQGILAELGYSQNLLKWNVPDAGFPQILNGLPSH